MRCLLPMTVRVRADAIATFNLRDLRGPAARFGIGVELPADVLGGIR